MRVELTNVTPDFANELLGRNAHNRPLQRNRVRSLAAAMRSGKWALNGETVIVSEQGTLLDGQHRLKAVTEYGQSVPMLIAYGAADDSFETIDTGKARSAGDILGMQGFKVPGKVAASAKLVWQMIHQVPLTIAAPPVYLSQVAERFPAIEKWACKTAGMGVDTIVPTSTLIAALTYLEDIAKKPETAEAFFAALTEGTSLEQGSPVLALRNRLIRARSGGARIDAKWALPITMKAVSAYEQGKKAERFRLEQSSGPVEVPELLDYHVRHLSPSQRLGDLLPPEALKEQK